MGGAVFPFGLKDDWLKGAKMVGELEGTISTPSSRFPGTKEA